MDRRKSPVMKSNSTSEAKKNNCSAQENNKKTRSSAEFQAKIRVTGGGFQPLKRRGVYVEKKTIKVPINMSVGPNSDVRPSSARVLPHRIRRPDKKRFLTNVLTLLSKNTAGTQCGGSDSKEELFIIEKSRPKNKKFKEEVVHKDPVPSLTPPPAAKKKSRYKSKSLSNHVNGEIDSLIVLQSTKEIVQTPSNDSECIPSLSKKAINTDIELGIKDWAAPRPPPDRQDLDTTPAKPSYSKKVYHHPNEEETVVQNIRNEKDIYNFFVDILTTTLSVCDVTNELDKKPNSNISLVIDEVVAKKLNIEKVKDNEADSMPHNESLTSSCNSKCYYSVLPDDRQEWNENFKPEFSEQYKVELTKKGKKPKVTSNSFHYKKAKIFPRTTSAPIPHTKIPVQTKRHNKKDFIYSIKQELQFDKEDEYEKPNFFQALKVMARNKQKQSVNFRTSRRPSDDNICTLKCRKVLSAKSSSKKQPKNSEKKHLAVVPKTEQTRYLSYNRPITIYETSSAESLHSNYSLEVIDYNDTEVKTNLVNYYQSPFKKRDYGSPSSNIVTAVAMSK